ncbi:MAG: ABC transporter substrate-binding protein [Solirubrobacteraceae bacterium]
MKLSRRYASCAIVAAIALSAAGCGSGSGGGSGSGSSQSSTGSGSTSSGGSSQTLTIGSNVAPPTLDPTASPAAAIDEVFDYNVYQHLVQLTPSGKLVPTLASSYSSSNGGRTYTFHVRKGVKFSNGDPLTAADVVFSLKRVVAPKSVYPYKGLMSDMQSARATGPETVQVTLKKRSWGWLYYLAAYSNGDVLDPKTVGHLATKPVGTGPFQFKSQVSNYSVDLAPNSDYWGPKPAVAGVTFRYFSTAESENTALQSGQIQVIDNAINPLDINVFKSDSAKYQIIHGLTNGKIQVTINNTSGPLKKLAVRQAIEYALNRPAIVKNAGGYGTPISSGAVPGDPWYVNLDSRYPYDPSKAKALLSQAGYPHGLPLTLTLPPYGYATQAGTVVASELSAVGIKTTIKNIQWPLWLSQVFTNHSYQLTIVDHVETRDIANYGNPAYYWNYAGAKTVARLEAEGDAAPSQSQWVAKYKQVVHMITGDAVNAWLYDPDQVTIAAKNVVGLPATGRAESFDLGHVRIGGLLPSSLTSEGYAN